MKKVQDPEDNKDENLSPWLFAAIFFILLSLIVAGVFYYVRRTGTEWEIEE
jgi:hypothetical protein